MQVLLRRGLVLLSATMALVWGRPSHGQEPGPAVGQVAPDGGTPTDGGLAEVVAQAPALAADPDGGRAPVAQDVSQSEIEAQSNELEAMKKAEAQFEDLSAAPATALYQGSLRLGGCGPLSGRLHDVLIPERAYLPLLPDALPFLGELLEDGDDGVARRARALVADLEAAAGESLDPYLKA